MKRNQQSGQVMVLVAFALIALIGMAGLVVDTGRSYADQRSLEAAAEAGAHAGAYLLETNWNGSAGNFGALTDAQVRTQAQTYAQYNGWSAANGDTFYLDYVKADKTTHVATLDNTARGVLVQLGKPQVASFTKVLGFRLYSDFARATAMFGSALVGGAIPFAVDDGCFPGTYGTSISAQPANASGGFGTCNFASIVPPGCAAGNVPCYQNAMANGMNPPVSLGPSYPVNSFDCCSLGAPTVASLQARISARPAETCTTFKNPSPRVLLMPVVPGGFGGASVVFTRYRAFFLTSIEPSTPSQGFTGCFVKVTLNSGNFDPNAVGAAYGAVMIMKLVRSTGAILPVTVALTGVTSPAPRGVANGATLTVHTDQPGATCTILVYDIPPAPGSPSVAGGLGPKITDASGNASWTWTVEATALTGLVQIQVRCTYDALLGYLFTSTTIS
jgi:Flp pilus assembly protein TadG